MPDLIQGSVTIIIDGDTFDIVVENTSIGNEFKYDRTERIRVVGINAPELETDAGKIAKIALQNAISGKTVLIIIDARDNHKRLIGTYSIVA